MKKTLKKIFCLLFAVVITVSLGTNAFAANQYYNKGFRNSGAVYNHTVTFTKLGTDKVTIVNTSSSGQLYVRCVGASNATCKYIAPNSEYTFAYYGNGPFKVTVQPLYRGTQTYRIKTTSGTIK